MANWLGTILGGGVGEIVEKIGDVADRFITTDEEKTKFKLESLALAQSLQIELEETFRSEIGSRERVLVAELQQTDNFTKRARPSVVYAGLAMIFINYVIFPGIGMIIEGRFIPVELPDNFWYAWGGLVTTWVIGRTVEKSGNGNNVTNVITGNKTPKIISSILK